MGSLAIRPVALDPTPGLGQLAGVVGCADHRLFAPDLIDASEQELSEASGLLDLLAHGLDHLFLEAIAAAAAIPIQTRSHRAH